MPSPRPIVQEPAPSRHDGDLPGVGRDGLLFVQRHDLGGAQPGLGHGLGEGTDLAGARRRLRQRRACLHQAAGALVEQIAHDEVDLVAGPGQVVGDLALQQATVAAPQLEEHGVLKPGAHVGGRHVGHGRREARVDRVELARVGRLRAYRLLEHRDREHQIGVLEVVEQCVQEVLRNGETARPQVPMRPVDAEGSSWGLQEQARESPHRSGVLDAMPLDDVAKQDELDVVLERLDAFGPRHPLHLGEAADRQIAVEVRLELRTRLGPRWQRGRHRDTVGDGALGEAVGKDLDRDPATAELGRHFGVEELRGRPAHHDLHLLGVEHAPHEAWPLGGHLYFVEEEVRTASARIRIGAVERLEQLVEQSGRDRLQPVVFEVGVQQVALVDSRGLELPHALIHEVGLADAPHADDHARLARSDGHADEPGAARGDVRLEELGNEEVRLAHGSILTV